MHSPLDHAACRRTAKLPSAFRSSLVLTASLALIAALAVPACAPPEPYEINQASVERVITVLAADDMEGRMTFTPSLWRAADFIAAEYADIGLEPYVGNELSGGTAGEGAEHR